MDSRTQIHVVCGNSVSGIVPIAGVLPMLSLKGPRLFMMTRNLGRFVSDETGQDLIEYSLLLAFIALAGAAAFMGMNTSVNTIWSVANSHLAAANGS